MTWWYWALLGFAFLGIEILTLGGLGNFYFLFFGTAALVVSAIVWLGLAEATWIQWVLFATLGIISLLVLRGPLQRKIHSQRSRKLDRRFPARRNRDGSGRSA